MSYLRKKKKRLPSFKVKDKAKLIKSFRRVLKDEVKQARITEKLYDQTVKSRPLWKKRAKSKSYLKVVNELFPDVLESLAGLGAVVSDMRVEVARNRLLLLEAVVALEAEIKKSKGKPRNASKDSSKFVKVVVNNIAKSTSRSRATSRPSKAPKKGFLDTIIAGLLKGLGLSISL